MGGFRPTKRQLEYMDWEFGVFFHFGIRSFFRGHRDWDGKDMPAAAFHPQRLDCDQWLRIASEAGARYAVLTAKHHDGFCNWPSAHSDYCVRNSPWKDGRGDVVAEYVAACRKYGVKVGLYCSPAQWGGDVDYADEAAYDDHFIRQLTELLTHYGKIDYIWFDGCGSDKHRYDGARITAAARALQPEICVFEMWDPDVRWAENENGYMDTPNWNPVRETDHTRHFLQGDQGGQFPEPRFLPAECDFMMRDRTWFDCEDNADTVKSVEELMGIYELSVGRGANFLINIGPCAEGTLPIPDAGRLLAFGSELRRRYGQPLPFSRMESRGGAWVIEAESDQLINRVVLREDLSEGQSVRSFALYARMPLFPHNQICIYRGETIGHKAICVFPAIRAGSVMLEIEGHEGDVRMRDMEAFFVT